MSKVINHKRGDCIWFHTTKPERVENIKRFGLKIGSEPTWQSHPEPWIYVSTEPWYPEDTGWIVLEVDLSWLSVKDCGWPFIDYTNSEEWDNRWQLRVFKDVPPMYIRELEGVEE